MKKEFSGFDESHIAKILVSHQYRSMKNKPNASFTYEVIVEEAKHSIIIIDKNEDLVVVCDFKFINNDNLKINNIRMLSGDKLDNKSFKNLFFHLKRI